MPGKASLFALLGAVILGQGPAAATLRDRALFRGSLTATLVVAGAPDSARASGCRLIAIEWRPLAGAAAYQVQVRVGANGTWVAVRVDPRCGGGGEAGPTAFHDEVVRPAARRDYRVVALGRDGRSLDVTAVVPVDVR